MHVGHKNSHSTCDHQTSAEFQTKNLADLQIKYYRAAQALVFVAYTVCALKSLLLLTCSKITNCCSPKTKFEVHLNGILHYFCMGMCLVEQKRLNVVVQGSFREQPLSLQQFAECWCHSLAKAQPGCPVPAWEGRIGLALLLPWGELCLHRTQLCFTEAKTVQG